MAHQKQAIANKHLQRTASKKLRIQATCAPEVYRATPNIAGETAASIASRLTLPKLHLATYHYHYYQYMYISFVFKDWK